MNITQLQAYVDSKPDIRELINKIVDFLQANPGGAGGVTLYSADSALSSDRTVDLDGKILKFEDENTEILFDPLNYKISFELINGVDKESEITIGGSDTTPRVDMYIHDGLLEAEINIGWDEAIIPAVNITAGDGTNNGRISVHPDSITHTADTHTFNGKIINPDIVASDFADDAAAAAGGIDVGGFYHTTGIVKVRLS